LATLVGRIPIFMATTNTLSTRALIKRYRALYVIILPGLLFLLLFRYYPIFLQTVLSFKDYRLLKGVWGSAWVGGKNFAYVFSSPEILRVVWNTVSISLLRLLVGFAPPILLSIMLFDLYGTALKKTSQTIVYIPHFFSWTIVYAIIYALFSNSGVVNGLMTALGLKTRDYLMDQHAFLPLLLFSALWKELGWSTIIYLAALMSINTELFEVAKIDGAGPLKRIWYVTLPGISSVIIYLLILSLGNILRGSGTEQILLFYSPPVYSISDVIDTWVYREGLARIQYSLGCAISFLQAIFGLILILICNRLAVKHAGVGIW
jgi:putative aldouronate transport system permease protein